ncbi:putative membrane protein [Thermococcus sp. 2319x1]|nr:putative membrane protein [Thermococcus sp. 2319x1]
MEKTKTGTLTLYPSGNLPPCKNGVCLTSWGGDRGFTGLRFLPFYFYTGGLPSWFWHSGGYVGSNCFHPVALLITGFFWLASSTLEWIICSTYRDSEYCAREGRVWFVYSAVAPVSNVFVWVFRFYPYSTAVISFLWTLVLFRVSSPCNIFVNECPKQP